MATVDGDKEEEKMELAAEVVGAVTKATVGFAVDRAAATVSEEQGLPPPSRSTSQQESAGAKRKALVGLLSNFVAFLKADGPMEPRPSAGGPQAAQRRAAEAAKPKGIDFTCGAVLLSCPTPYQESDQEAGVSGGGGSAAAMQPARLPLWRRLTLTIMEKTGLMARVQQAVRDSVPRMPREALMMVAGVTGAELAKREIAAQVEALEEPVRGPAWALLNETYRNIEARGVELVESNWDFSALITKQLADWKRRGVGNSYQEALLKEVIELQTRALLRPISLPADEGSLMVQLNATYRNIEESIGRLLPEQTKEQLSLLEGLVRKLDDKGIGELSFDEVYRALLLGAVPPALVTDAVRLLAAGRPGEGGGAAFLSGEAGQAYYGREGGGDVTLASLAARLNDTREVSRVMTYTALAAETEVIENLREVLDGLQTNIRRSLVDMETELKQPPPPSPSVLQGAASYANNAARSAVTVAIDGFNNASKIFDASFEALAEPSRRTLLRSSELFPWKTWYQAWTNITRGEDNLFADEHKLLSAAASAEVEVDDLFVSSPSSGGGATAQELGPVADAVVAGSGDAADSQDGVLQPWWGRRSVKRWRPEEETLVEPPGHGGGESGVGGGVPAAMKLGRKRWKG
eukprot:g6004.t1